VTAVTLAETLLHALRARGATALFGIPGDFALPLFRVIEESAILPLYTLSHEPAVGFAADAAARAGGGLGVAVVTYGAGGLNIVNATACALAEKSPLVVISGAPGVAERAGDLLLHHQGKTLESQLRVFREITCDQAVLDDPLQAPAAIARVLQSAREFSRPVYVEVPRDLVDAPCAPVPPSTPSPIDREMVEACAVEVLEVVSRAQAPVLMVGVEVKRCGIEDKVAALAARLQLPVVTSFMGRGLLADAAVPPLGTYLGVAGEAEITRLVEESDALLLLGVILSDSNLSASRTRIDLRRTIQALDRRVTLGFHTYSPVPLEAFIDALLEHTARRPPCPPPAPAIPPVRYPRGLPADAAPITPEDIACAVNDVMDRHGPLPIAADMGDCVFTATRIAYTHLTAPAYYATMGYGVPAGLGLQVAMGTRPLILVGDGAFQMTGVELGNCQRYGWDPIVVVFNNSGWEMLRAFQPASRCHDLADWHYAELARVLGGEGVRVATRQALAAALERAATTRGRFFLIEAMLQRGVMSTTLARYVAASRPSRPLQRAGGVDVVR
jgi:indolepyruvate decarboxylase